MDDTDGASGKRKKKSGKSGATSGATSVSGKGKGGSVKKSSENSTGGAKKKKGSGKKNAVHALAVEPSVDEGISEISQLEVPAAVALTPVQTISIAPSGHSGGTEPRADGEKAGNVETEISPLEENDQEAP